MKRVLTIAALAVALHTGASAQNTIYKATEGAYVDASGAVVVSDPSTTVAVDLIIEKEQTIVGPYVTRRNISTSADRSSRRPYGRSRALGCRFSTATRR
mgnify:CR=1 FL=1